MILWKMAWRNVFRNKRRTILNLIMMVGGFCAIIVFRGFSNRIILIVQEHSIKTHLSHMQVGKEKLWDRAPVDSMKELFLNEPQKLIDQIKSVSNVRYTSGRTNFYSLLNHHEKSVSVAVEAFDPKVEEEIYKTLIITEGQNFSLQDPMEIIIGRGLQKILNLKIGEPVTLVAQTVDGGINAIDPIIRGVFVSGFTEIDKTTIFLTLKASQKLLDTDGHETIAVMLNETENIPQSMAKIEDIIRVDPELKIRTWKDLNDLYKSTKGYFDVQNIIIGFVITMIVFLGIVNTVGMSIFERTGEIGTMRALGDTGKDVVKQFGMEGIILGLFSAMISIPCAIVLASIINKSRIPLMIPGASGDMHIEIGLYVGDFIFAFVITFFTGIIAALLPAFRATKISIVDALRKV